MGRSTDLPSGASGSRRGWCPTREQVVVCLLVLAIGLSVWDRLDLFGTTKRLSHDEGNTCHIQRRGLPASKHLAVVVAEIDKLLTVPTAHIDLQAVPEPARRYLKGLEYHSRAYGQIEARQPATRSCP